MGAYADEDVAVWAYVHLAEQATESVRSFRSMGRHDVAQAIESYVADLREAAMQFRESKGEPSGRGNAEVPTASSGAPYVRMVAPEGSTPAWADVRAASDALGVSERRVRQLLAAGDLTGRQDRTGRWSVDRHDLDRLVADRKAIA